MCLPFFLRSRFPALLVAFFVTASAWSAAAVEVTKPQENFFETKIRPLFVRSCYPCHSSAKGKVKGGLELDWKGGWEKGGQSGAAIVPGQPEQSLLIKAVRGTDPDLQMPPKGEKLSADEVKDLVAWVQMGAPDPRLVRPSSSPLASSNGKDHWAFRAPVKAPLPSVEHASWVKNDIDRFVLAKLEANGLAPSASADKRTLIRRLYFDVIGLPPTPEQVRAFVEDTSDGAYEKAVDALLSSPHYGERWARHWLDVARYSDSKGQFNRRRESSVYPAAWSYRDYVIESLNEDKPYNRFIVEQLAADRLNLGTNRMALAALGFLTLGDHFNGNPHEIINDRIDVTTKAFLGLTVACARCHDHKFDPIPQADYYSLHGIFSSSVEPLWSPEIRPAQESAEHRDYLQRRAALDARLATMRTQNLAVVFGDYKRLAGVYLFATTMAGPERLTYLIRSGGDTNVLKNWTQISRAQGPQASAIFGIWNALAKIPPASFANQAPRFLANLDRNPRGREANSYVLQAFKSKSPRTLAEAAVIYGSLFASQDPGWETNLVALLNDAVLRFLPNRERAKVSALREQSDFLEMLHPGAPVRAPVLLDSPTPKDSPIFIRGEAENRGEIVPRRFLEVLSGPNRPVFKAGSGRLELAQAIANKNNPLTARVLVNRVWLHHFGEGLVTTPEDFGTQSAPPSHPELLDYLALRFMDDGWSMKRLHKLILLSATYQQGSDPNAVAVEKDPFNRWLWRANTRRLEFEPLRDSILYLGGSLDLSVGGHPVELSSGSNRRSKSGAVMLQRAKELRLAQGSRRTIYGYIDRADLAEDLNTFDFPSPASPVGKRYQSTVPQQALFLMNSPLVIEQVRALVQRSEFKTQKSDAARIEYLYGLFFQRTPTQEELQRGQEFIHSLTTPLRDQGLESPRGGAVAEELVTLRPETNRTSALTGTGGATNRLGPWEEFAHALLLTNEAFFTN